MKTMVVFDSLYGNTRVIAQAIADAIPGKVIMVHVSDFSPADIHECDLLIVGGPTHGGGPSDPMKALLAAVGDRALQGTAVAAFDTRLTWWWLRPFGYAAPKIARALKQKGGRLLAPGKGFVVTGGKGPLPADETEHAAAWAAALVTKVGATAGKAAAPQILSRGG
jgi:flavodoxin